MSASRSKQVITGVLKGPVIAYRVLISPAVGPRCRFYPTCSRYFLDAVDKYGPWKGALMGIKRILKCNPFCEGGYDPLP